MSELKDPRLVEIEILSAIDQATFGGSGYYRYNYPGSRGVWENLKHEALLHLAFDGTVIDSWAKSFPSAPPGIENLGMNDITDAVSQVVPQVLLSILHLQTCTQGTATVKTDGIAAPLTPQGLPKADGSLEGGI
jgi:hypothetical protein